MIRGNVEREVVAGEDWDAWTAAGLVVGEDPELDGKRFRISPNGICLITQQMIDGLNA